MRCVSSLMFSIRPWWCKIVPVADMKYYLRRTLIITGRWLLLLALLLTCCQSKLIYHPRGYDRDYILQQGAEPLNYTTGQGAQMAWMLHAENAQPPRVWLVFSGNGTCALDMVPYFRSAHPVREDLIVLMDYPGYGQCQGRPTPDNIRESVRALVPAVAAQLKTTRAELSPRLRVFGHSLGCAAALMAMNEHGIRRGALVAPFTSMLDMAQGTVGWPLCYVLHHRFDNVESLRALKTRSGVRLEVVHGTEDEVIPFAQGVALAKAFPEIISFRPAQGGFHNRVLNSHEAQIMDALEAARRD